MELLDQGKYRAVVALLEPVQEAGNPQVLYNLGSAYYYLDKYQEVLIISTQRLISDRVMLRH